MNFLAHLYLSGDNDLVKIGNFMADGIRGKHFEHLPQDVQNGIRLHRAIDTFTDAHPIFRTSTKRLHDKYHHYAGVIVDVVYDHFLAKNWAMYSHEKLDIFIQNFYASLHDHYEILTERTKGMMPYMIGNNWLWSYQFVDGIGKILTQMDQRTRNDSRMREAITELREHYAEFEHEFTSFFEELREFAAQQRLQL